MAFVPALGLSACRLYKVVALSNLLYEYTYKYKNTHTNKYKNTHTNKYKHEHKYKSKWHFCPE